MSRSQQEWWQAFKAELISAGLTAKRAAALASEHYRQLERFGEALLEFNYTESPAAAARQIINGSAP